MHIILNETVKCSQCGSHSHEHVTHGNLKFERCRSCGHEGKKTEIIPTPKASDKGIAWMLSQRPIERTF